MDFAEQIKQQALASHMLYVQAMNAYKDQSTLPSSTNEHIQDAVVIEESEESND